MTDPPWQQRNQRGAARLERRAPQKAADGEPLFGVVIWGVHPEHATSAAALRRGRLHHAWHVDDAHGCSPTTARRHIRDTDSTGL